jgi:hypothetical protein
VGEAHNHCMAFLLQQFIIKMKQRATNKTKAF